MNKPDHWNKGKQHALKDEDDKATSTIIYRCQRAHKARCVKRAQALDMKLTEYLIDLAEQDLNRHDLSDT